MYHPSAGRTASADVLKKKIINAALPYSKRIENILITFILFNHTRRVAHVTSVRWTRDPSADLVGNLTNNIGSKQKLKCIVNIPT